MPVGTINVGYPAPSQRPNPSTFTSKKHIPQASDTEFAVLKPLIKNLIKLARDKGVQFKGKSLEQMFRSGEFGLTISFSHGVPEIGLQLSVEKYFEDLAPILNVFKIEGGLTLESISLNLSLLCERVDLENKDKDRRYDGNYEHDLYTLRSSELLDRSGPYVVLLVQGMLRDPDFSQADEGIELDLQNRRSLGIDVRPDTRTMAVQTDDIEPRWTTVGRKGRPLTSQQQTSVDIVEKLDRILFSTDANRDYFDGDPQITIKRDGSVEISCEKAHVAYTLYTLLKQMEFIPSDQRFDVPEDLNEVAYTLTQDQLQQVDVELSRISDEVALLQQYMTEVGIKGVSVYPGYKHQDEDFSYELATHAAKRWLENNGRPILFPRNIRLACTDDDAVRALNKLFVLLDRTYRTSGGFKDFLGQVKLVSDNDDALLEFGFMSSASANQRLGHADQLFRFLQSAIFANDELGGKGDVLTDATSGQLFARLRTQGIHSEHFDIGLVLNALKGRRVGAADAAFGIVLNGYMIFDQLAEITGNPDIRELAGSCLSVAIGEEARHYVVHLFFVNEEDANRAKSLIDLYTKLLGEETSVKKEFEGPALGIRPRRLVPLRPGEGDSVRPPLFKVSIPNRSSAALVMGDPLVWSVDTYQHLQGIPDGTYPQKTLVGSAMKRPDLLTFGDVSKEREVFVKHVLKGLFKPNQDRMEKPNVIPREVIWTMIYCDGRSPQFKERVGHAIAEQNRQFLIEIIESPMFNRLFGQFKMALKESISADSDRVQQAHDIDSAVHRLKSIMKRRIVHADIEPEVGDFNHINVMLDALALIEDIVFLIAKGNPSASVALSCFLIQDFHACSDGIRGRLGAIKQCLTGASAQKEGLVAELHECRKQMVQDFLVMKRGAGYNESAAYALYMQHRLRRSLGLDVPEHVANAYDGVRDDVDEDMASFMNFFNSNYPGRVFDILASRLKSEILGLVADGKYSDVMTVLEETYHVPPHLRMMIMDQELMADARALEKHGAKVFIQPIFEFVLPDMVFNYMASGGPDALFQAQRELMSQF